MRRNELEKNKQGLIKPKDKIQPREKIIDRLGDLTKEEVKSFYYGKEGDGALSEIQNIAIKFKKAPSAVCEIGLFRGGAVSYAIGETMPTTSHHINKQKLVDALSDVLTSVGKDNPELKKNLKVIESLFDTRIGVTIAMDSNSSLPSR